MKNQYFADRRDLFKYDLLLDLVEAHGGRRLTYVPMLTPNDGSSEGKLSQADCRNRKRDVFEFLKSCADNEQRDIRKLRDLMPHFGVTFLPYRDARLFTQVHRAEYFEDVPSDSLRNSVVFFDPDIGLETRTSSYMARSGREKYLLYAELSGVWSRMPEDSVLVVYQHLQKDATKRAGDVARRLTDFRERLGAVSLAVQWHDLAFLVSVRQAEAAERIRKALRDHSDRHEVVLYGMEASLRPTSAGPSSATS